MTKVVVKNLNAAKNKAASRKRNSVIEKRVRDADGRVKILRTLDAGSRTFGADLQYVFSKNVTKARRDNKRAIGKSDVVIAKR